MDDETRTLLRAMESHIDSIRKKVGVLYWMVVVTSLFMAGATLLSFIQGIVSY